MKNYHNFKQLVTLQGAKAKDGRNLAPSDVSVLEGASLISENGKILWVGKSDSVPSKYQAAKVIDCSKYVGTPEIVDSHTHLVFGGNRAFEYTMRLNGEDYEAIAKAGGGILSTMEKTKNEKRELLFKSACERIERLYGYGIGTIEIKSGYALEKEKEREISLLINDLKKEFSGRVQIFNTYLAAHAVPKTFSNSREYMDQVVLPLLEELAKDKAIDAADIFHEKGYFDEDDTRSLFKKAKELGVALKIHADEFNDNKGALIASEYGALSADHLLATAQDGIEALSKSKTVATLLPGTAFFLGKPLANAKAFLDAGCKVALASDYNPGSCHCDNLVLIASMAGKNLGLNAAQLWASVTLNAAAALGLDSQGHLSAGADSRLSFFECDSFDEIIYSWGRNFAVKADQVN